jgi:hypothetical protein
MRSIELRELRTFIRGYNNKKAPRRKPFKVVKKTYSDFTHAGIVFYGCNMGSVCHILTVPEYRQEWAEFNRALAKEFKGVEFITIKGKRIVGGHIFETANYYADEVTKNKTKQKQTN